MFSGLRLRLTLLYLLAALALVALVGGGAYQLVGSYFQATTDLALKHKMVGQLGALGAPVPAELAEADQAWFATRSRSPALAPPSTGTPTAANHEGNDGETNDDGASEEAYDADLAAIFTLRLGQGGQVLRGAGVAQPPFAPNPPAFDTAMARGDDLRTVTLPDGRRSRVLTYRVETGAGPAAVQLGRLLTDQDRVLQRLLLGLLALGGVSAVLMGAASWWLAGRSIRPAQQAWERQQSFVANASHELRTPLTLLRATAEVALRGLPAADASSRELLADVLQECDHMSRLVEDLLLLSRLDADRLKMERIVIALPPLLADVERQVGRLAEERDIQVVADGVSGAVWGDPTRVRQVLLILLDNALRHLQSGGVIRLTTAPQGHSTRITVADTGCGIAPEHLPHVFERFYRADSAGRDDSGSGLGLSIVKALVEAQGGLVAIESQLGKGTRVVVTLPSAAAGDRVQMRLSPPSAHSPPVQEPRVVADYHDPDAG
jgi:signal transduction histidine kinase